MRKGEKAHERRKKNVDSSTVPMCELYNNGQFVNNSITEIKHDLFLHIADFSYKNIYLLYRNQHLRNILPKTECLPLRDLYLKK